MVKTVGYIMARRDYDISLILLLRKTPPQITASDRGPRMWGCEGPCLVLTNVGVAREPGGVPGGQEVGLGTVPRLLQWSVKRGSLLTGAWLRGEKGRGRRHAARLCATQPASPWEAQSPT